MATSEKGDTGRERGSKSSPSKRAFRMAGLGLNVAGSYVGYLVQRAFLDESARATKLKSAHNKAARRVRSELQELRGPAMKLGQALSLQGGVLPDEALEELSQLQMHAPPMHPTLMGAQFRASMGRDPEDVFRKFDAEPFAAASLGQVHHAVTRDGQAVAVKIQYPDIGNAVANDFAWFRTVSRPAQLTGHMPTASIDELERQIVAETDYGNEADNAEFFAKQLAPLDWVTVPGIRRDLSTRTVLTMSVVPGLHLDDWLRRRPNQALRDLVGARLLELFYFQILRVHAFHADPNSGNYLFTDNGGVGLIDFGCVKHLTPEFVETMYDLYLFPGARDSKHFHRLLERRYALTGNRLRPAVRRSLVQFAENFYRKVYPPNPESDGVPYDFGKGTAVREYLAESRNLMGARGALPEYTFLARAELGLYHALIRLRARVHTSRIVRSFLT